MKIIIMNAEKKINDITPSVDKNIKSSVRIIPNS